MSKPRTFFKDGYIRLSQVTTLNDPFEAVYCEDSLNDLASNFENTIAWDGQLGEMSFSDYVKYKRQNVGVISFTESKENLLMWAHYADEHRGVVAGISKLAYSSSIFEKLFRGETLINNAYEGHSLFDGVPKPVMYRKGMRYRNDRFDYDYSHIEAEGADRILYEVFMQKSDEWIYEKEHRIVLRLEQADKVITPNLESIQNEKVKKDILNASWCAYDEKLGNHEISLNQIENDTQRIVIAMELVTLSNDQRTIFLMKLKPNTITHCLLGLNYLLTEKDVTENFCCSAGYFEVLKASRDNNSYSLEFKQI